MYSQNYHTSLDILPVNNFRLAVPTNAPLKGRHIHSPPHPPSRLPFQTTHGPFHDQDVSPQHQQRFPTQHRRHVSWYAEARPVEALDQDLSCARVRATAAQGAESRRRGRDKDRRAVQDGQGGV